LSRCRRRLLLECLAPEAAAPPMLYAPFAELRSSTLLDVQQSQPQLRLVLLVQVANQCEATVALVALVVVEVEVVALSLNHL